MLETPVITTCPNCDAEDVRGARFCPHCGVALGGNGTAPAVHAPLVKLLTEVAELQHEMLRQFEKGRRVQNRGFERAMRQHADALQSTLDYHSDQSQRLQGWVKWTVVLAAAVVLLIVVAAQISG